MKARPVRPSAVTPAPLTQEQIAALAHELWRERGCPAGSDLDIWLEAERQLRGVPPQKTARDPIPANPAATDIDSDPALNPDSDREIGGVGGPSDRRSPTAFGV